MTMLITQDEPALDRSSGYRPYEATRAFWEHNGFVQIDTIDPLPGWPPGNPAAIYVAAVRPPRDIAAGKHPPAETLPALISVSGTRRCQA
jgi:hypothetical protein